MYNIGDYVVYGLTGVCIISDITEEHVPGRENSKYYVLNPVFSKNTTVKIPVNNKKIILRDTIGTGEAARLLEESKTLSTEWEDNYRLRNDIFREAMHSCDCSKWLWLVKTIHQKANELSGCGKKLRQTDEFFLINSEKLLYGELATALNKTYDEIKDALISNFNNCKAI